MLRIEAFAPKDPRFDAFVRLQQEKRPGSQQAPVDASAHCLLAWRNHYCVGRLTLQVVNDFVNQEKPVGVVGNFEALDDEAGFVLLQDAQKRLVNKGVDHIVGPMNGSPWYGYRFALPREPIDRDYQPPFFQGEPHNELIYPHLWETAGFVSTHTYQSRIVTQLADRSTFAQAVTKELEEAGVVFKHLDEMRFDQQLFAIYELTMESAKGGPYFQPVNYEEFNVGITPLRPILDPELILFAWVDDRPIAALFAYPDSLSKMGEQPTRIVARRVVVAEEVAGSGLDVALLERLHRVAYEKGYVQVIHALLYDQAITSFLGGSFSTDLFRRYALYTWKV